MARPINLPWDFSTFSGPEAITKMSDEFNALRNAINDAANGWVNFGIDAGSVNAYVVTLPSTPSAYVAGMTVSFVPLNTNTGASTVNVNSLGSVSVLTKSGVALSNAALQASSVATIVYDGSAFRLVTGSSDFLVQTYNTGVQIGALSLDCAGASDVAVFVTWTGAPATLNLNHVGQGVRVSITVVNATGGATTFKLNLTDQTGTAYTGINAYQAGAANGTSNIIMSSTGISLNSGAKKQFMGISNLFAVGQGNIDLMT